VIRHSHGFKANAWPDVSMILDAPVKSRHC